MTSTFTPALHLEMPARGDYANSWDLPANANYESIDAAVGGSLSLTGLNGGTVVLTQAQANASMLFLSGNLSGNLIIAWPATAAGRKLIFPSITLNGFFLYLRGNGGSDGIGVYMPTAFGIPTPIIVTPSRVYWDYCGLCPGIITSFPNTFIPNGWLPCDGRELGTSQFDLLFDILGYSYGGGGASFNIPDYRGYALVGSDNMGAGSAGRFFNYGPNGIYGEITHLLSQAEMPAHVHGVGDPGHTHGASQPAHAHAGVVTGISGGPYLAPGAGFTVTSGDTAAAQPAISVNAAATGIYLGSAGSSGAHNNVQPSRTVNKYIRW